jgi:uncharacterized repeat protein (TIGR04042 family)
MTFEVRWPDGSVQRCYAPSLVVHDHLSIDSSYPVADFLARSDRALREAGERVRAKYGFACTSAAATSEQIRSAAVKYSPDAEVTVLTMQPALETS